MPRIKIIIDTPRSMYLNSYAINNELEQCYRPYSDEVFFLEKKKASGYKFNIYYVSNGEVWLKKLKKKTNINK